MKKSTFNFLVDALLFICLCLITGLGFLIKYTLPSGQDKWLMYQTNNRMLWLNMDRHQWGDIHLIISLIFILLLIVHMAMHWAFVSNMTRKILKQPTIRIVTIIAFTSISLSLLLLPFFITPATITNSDKKKYQALNLSHSNPTDKTSEINTPTRADLANNRIHKNKQHWPVKGSMTLNEVVEQNSIPLNYLIKKLHMPKHVNTNEKLGRLKRKYGFTMSEIEKIIGEFQKSNE
ncbi:MAG: DUF4405 domain-containing protein [Carboxylicivirga sp.]|jgi:hypothetical protein|nr:DUF4405 domain-containing protein [Carboxylicivirga sp.]